MTSARPVKPHFAICALESLHSELGGKITDNKREAERLAEAMRHVEAVLKLLHPGYNTRPIAVRRRKPNPWFKRGTVFRHVLDVLRPAPAPMTARQIVEAMLKANGIADASKQDVRAFVTTVQTCLQSNSGRTVVNVAEGMPGRWKIMA
jgi:hypothetical protein